MKLKPTTTIVIALTILLLSSNLCFSSNLFPSAHTGKFGLTNLLNDFYLSSQLGSRVLTEHANVAIGWNQLQERALYASGGEIVHSKSPNEAFLYSLAIPGMGQLYTKAKHGYIYMAAEVGLLTAFFLLRNSAVNTRDDYRDVVRENLIFIGPGSFDKWDPIEDFEHATQYENWNHVYDSDATRKRTGKWYWKDLDPSLKDEKDSTIEFDSKYRLEAYDLRQKANDTFQTARTVLGAVLLNHIISAVEARIAAKRWNQKNLPQTEVGFNLTPNISSGTLTGTLFLKKYF